MRLAIRHTTRYTFEEPVVHALQRLRLTPKTTQGQKILSWDMTFENAKCELEYEDQHHNTVSFVAVEQGAREVLVRCDGMVDTEDNLGVIGSHSGHLPLWSFLAQTRLTRPGEKVRALLEGLECPKDGKLDFLHALSRQIADRVDYRIGETQVHTTAEESAAQGSGVCQDHAHIFIGAARAHDIPARYVSGYLMMNDRVEQEATHAWAEAHVQGIGWVGFDISNRISPDPRYVRVATGRDYNDASPIRSMSYGSSPGNLSVDLAIEQQTVAQ